MQKPKTNIMKFLTQAFNSNSIIHGLWMTISGTVLTGIYTSINSGGLPQTLPQWKVILTAGLGAGIAYLLKNGFAGSSSSQISKQSNP